MFGEGGDDIFEIGGFASDMGLSPAGGLQNGWDSFIGGIGYDTIRILPTSGYAWTAIQVDYIDGVEALSNTAGGPGYVYFRGNIDFSGIVSMTGINEFRGSASDDTFNGGVLAETVRGYGGNDTIYGNGGMQPDRIFAPALSQRARASHAGCEMPDGNSFRDLRKLTGF